MAESTTDKVAQGYIASLKEIAGTGESTALFTITITTTNLKTKKQVCKWDIEWNKGSVSGKKLFTITITTTNLKTKKQVCKWDIEWNKGSVSGKKY